MKHVRLISQFSEDLANLSREVETSVAMGLLDINKVCEDLFCGMFRELYGFKNIRNLNEEERQNFPGIDLADDDAKVAIQVTSDKSLEKVKDSLKKIISACPETTCFCEYPGRINSSGRWHRSSVAN